MRLVSLLSKPISSFLPSAIHFFFDLLLCSLTVIMLGLPPSLRFPPLIAFSENVLRSVWSFFFRNGANAVVMTTKYGGVSSCVFFFFHTFLHYIVMERKVISSSLAVRAERSQLLVMVFKWSQKSSAAVFHAPAGVNVCSLCVRLLCTIYGHRIKASGGYSEEP